MVTYIRFFVYLITFVTYSFSSVAQSISASFWRDTVVVNTGATFINRLAVTNTTNQSQDVKITVDIPASIDMLAAVPTHLHLSPGETIRMPIKGLVHRQITAANIPVYLRLTDDAGKPIQ